MFSAERIPTSQLKEGKVSWQSPSNIALIKYWGKKSGQIPCNPSISFTLTEAHTQTSIEYWPKEKGLDGISIDFFF